VLTGCTPVRTDPCTHEPKNNALDTRTDEQRHKNYTNNQLINNSIIITVTVTITILIKHLITDDEADSAAVQNGRMESKCFVGNDQHRLRITTPTGYHVLLCMHSHTTVTAAAITLSQIKYVNKLLKQNSASN